MSFSMKIFPKDSNYLVCDKISLIIEATFKQYANILDIINVTKLNMEGTLLNIVEIIVAEEIQPI